MRRTFIFHCFQPWLTWHLSPGDKGFCVDIGAVAWLLDVDVVVDTSGFFLTTTSLLFRPLPLGKVSCSSGRGTRSWLSGTLAKVSTNGLPRSLTGPIEGFLGSLIRSLQCVSEVVSGSEEPWALSFQALAVTRNGPYPTEMPVKAEPVGKRNI